jgi:hydroxypyruvate reductase/glycerate 2-kinase
VAAVDPVPAPAAIETPRTAPAIKDLEALASRGERGARAAALRLATAGLTACDVVGATAATVALEGEGLTVGGERYELDPGGRVLVVGAGKASMAIGRELERILGDRLDGGAIVVRDGEEESLGRIEVIGADHPLPSGRSIGAARRLLALAEGAGERDIVIACFTGGSSALACLPPAAVTAAEKRELHELLLSSGISIVEVNTVRKHVSAIKGGRLAAAALPARLVNLTVSDVAGDHIDAITDPTVPDSSRAADAIAILYGHGLWDKAPQTIREHLQSSQAESPDLDAATIQTVLLVTGSTGCEAMSFEAAALSLDPVVVSTTLEGEARQVGRLLANLARHSAEHGAPFAPGTAMLGCGGESTVTLAREGGFGEGGPNQEAAIAAALELEGLRAAAVFLDTDGSDGGTNHAGAIVDGLTVRRAAETGIDLRAALLEHRSHVAMTALEDALVTGPTGTNVNDLFAIVIEPGE